VYTEIYLCYFIFWDGIGYRLLWILGIIGSCLLGFVMALSGPTRRPNRLLAFLAVVLLWIKFGKEVHIWSQYMRIYGIPTDMDGLGYSQIGIIVGLCVLTLLLSLEAGVTWLALRRMKHGRN
jgi:hypothetical protein